MCIVTNIKTNRRIGYKIMAIKQDLKSKTTLFFSGFTGQEITVGKVPLPPKRCNRLINAWNQDLDIKELKNLAFYNKEMIGKTSAFLSIDDLKKPFISILATASARRIGYRSAIVKITFDKEVFKGTFSGFDVILSSWIKSMEIMEIYEYCSFPY